MKKLTLMLALLLLAGLACTSVQIADPAFQQGGDAAASTPDALATVLAEVAQVTQNAPTPTRTPIPTEDTAESADPDEDQAGDKEDADPTATPQPTSSNTGYPTAISLPNPDASGFKTCLTECLTDGSNDQDTFPAMTETIYFTFEFEEFPVKAPYTRTWAKAGTEAITLTEPMGLASGEWNVVITVNGEEVLDETITIEGNYSYWSPPGYFNGCYGKR